MKDSKNNIPRYRIGEIVKSTGISSFALKHYEKNGLLQPRIDEESGYRYYDVSDMGDAVAIRNLRKLNFSVKEIKDIEEGLSWENFMHRVKEKVDENVRQINWLMRANQSLEKRIQWMKRAGKHKNQWEMDTVASFDFMEHCRAGELLPDVLTSKADIWIRESCASYMAVRIPYEHLGTDSSGNAYWGFLLFDNDKEEEPPIDEHETYHFCGGDCLLYYYSQPTRQLFSPDYAESGIRAAVSQGYRIAGDVYGIFLGETIEEDIKKEDYIFFIPIKKD